MNKYSIKRFEKLRGAKPDQLFICGMGGSGLPGEILNSFRDEFGIKIPIVIWKDYNLPPHGTKNTLCVCVSFSGDTAETISALKTAIRMRYKVAVLTGGGELGRIAESHLVPLMTFDKGNMVPRFALNPMFEGLARIINLSGISSKRLPVPSPAKKQDVIEMLKFIDGKIPLVYTSGKLKSLAYIWKIWLNETAKTPAFINQLPELDHNEIVGFESRSTPFRVIFIEDPSELSYIKKRVALTGKLIRKLGGRTLIVRLRGKTGFERFWGGVYLGESVATKLALSKRRTPQEIRSIDTLKAWVKK